MILVEDIPKMRKDKMCKHIMSDNSIGELLAFADTVPLKREWLQVSNNGIPHFDIFSEKIDMRILELSGQNFICDCGNIHWMIVKMPIKNMTKRSIRIEREALK